MKNVAAFAGVVLGGVLLLAGLKGFFPDGFQEGGPATGPATRGAGQIVIVIDDIGNTLNNKELLRNLKSDVTYAVLPLLRHSGEFGRMAHREGAEVILHLPLPSVNETYPGPGLISEWKSQPDILTILRRNLDSVPHHVGVNNHMGSLGTQDVRLMKILMEEFRRHNLFFLDSFTTNKSRAYEAAKLFNVPYLKRDLFLDNTDTQEAVRAELMKLKERSRQKGFAIGIGHYRYNTLRVLNDEIPRIKNEGFEFISLRKLVRSKKAR